MPEIKPGIILESFGLAAKNIRREIIAFGVCSLAVFAKTTLFSVKIVSEKRIKPFREPNFVETKFHVTRRNPVGDEVSISRRNFVLRQRLILSAR